MEAFNNPKSTLRDVMAVADDILNTNPDAKTEQEEAPEAQKKPIEQPDGGSEAGAKNKEISKNPEIEAEEDEAVSFFKIPAVCVERATPEAQTAETTTKMEIEEDADSGAQELENSGIMAEESPRGANPPSKPDQISENGQNQQNPSEPEKLAKTGENEESGQNEAENNQEDSEGNEEDVEEMIQVFEEIEDYLHEEDEVINPDDPNTAANIPEPPHPVEIEVEIDEEEAEQIENQQMDIFQFLQQMLGGVPGGPGFNNPNLNQQEQQRNNVLLRLIMGRGRPGGMGFRRALQEPDFVANNWNRLEQMITEEKSPKFFELEVLKKYQISSSAIYFRKGEEIVLMCRRRQEEVEDDFAEEEDAEDQPEANPDENCPFCVIINTKTRKIQENKIVPPEGSTLTSEQISFISCSLSEDQNTIASFVKGHQFMRFENPNQPPINMLLLYNIDENRLDLHNFGSIDLYGHIDLDLQPDCTNESFDDYLIVELYSEEDGEGSNLCFYRYTLKTKKFDKVFEIPSCRGGKRLMHSLCKIDRNALHGHEDCLLVFRVTQNLNTGKILLEIFSVNLCTKILLFKASVQLNEDESRFRQAIRQPFLENSRDRFVIQLGKNSVLVCDKLKRTAKMFRYRGQVRHDDQCILGLHEADEEYHIGYFSKFHSLFPASKYEELKGRFTPSEAFRCFVFDRYCLLMSYYGFCQFRVDQFERLEDYVMLCFARKPAGAEGKDSRFFLYHPFLEGKEEEVGADEGDGGMDVEEVD